MIPLHDIWHIFPETWTNMIPFSRFGEMGDRNQQEKNILQPRVVVPQTLQPKLRVPKFWSSTDCRYNCCSIGCWVMWRISACVLGEPATIATLAFQKQITSIFFRSIQPACFVDILCYGLARHISPPKLWCLNRKDHDPGLFWVYWHPIEHPFRFHQNT